MRRPRAAPQPLGDIIIDGDDILGDGVNVAARLESNAPHRSDTDQLATDIASLRAAGVRK